MACPPAPFPTERESDYSSSSSSLDELSAPTPAITAAAAASVPSLLMPPPPPPLSSSSLPLPSSLSASSSSIATANSATDAEEEELSLNFGPAEPIHQWKKLSSCEEFVGAKRSKHTIVAWNDKVYVFGGDNGRRMLNDFLVSSIRDSSWARVVFTGELIGGGWRGSET